MPAQYVQKTIKLTLKICHYFNKILYFFVLIFIQYSAGLVFIYAILKKGMYNEWQIILVRETVHQRPYLQR